MNDILIRPDSAQKVINLFANKNREISQSWYDKAYHPFGEDTGDVSNVFIQLYARYSERDVSSIQILTIYERDSLLMFDPKSETDMRTLKNNLLQCVSCRKYCEMYALVHDHFVGVTRYVIFGLHETDRRLFINTLVLTRPATAHLETVNTIPLNDVLAARQARANISNNQLADPKLINLFNDYVPEIMKMIVEVVVKEAPNNKFVIMIPRKDCPEWNDVCMQALSYYIHWVVLEKRKDQSEDIRLKRVDYDPQLDMVVIELYLNNAIINQLK